MTMYVQHDRVQQAPGGPSRAKQSFQSDTDINNIMKKYEKTGLIDHIQNAQGKYGNFIIGGDYHDHLNSVMEAKASFNLLTASIRTKFDNDPAKFLQFAQNPENKDELISMGLLEPDRPDPSEKPQHPDGDGAKQKETTEDSSEASE